MLDSQQWTIDLLTITWPFITVKRVNLQDEVLSNALLAALLNRFASYFVSKPSHHYHFSSRSSSIWIQTRGVNIVPYWLIWLVYTVPVSKLVRLTPLFRTGKNTGRTGHILSIPAGTEKKFYYYYYYFLSFVIFEFLLGQNGNLFALAY